MKIKIQGRDVVKIVYHTNLIIQNNLLKTEKKIYNTSSLDIDAERGVFEIVLRDGRRIYAVPALGSSSSDGIVLENLRVVEISEEEKNALRSEIVQQYGEGIRFSKYDPVELVFKYSREEDAETEEETAEQEAEEVEVTLTIKGKESEINEIYEILQIIAKHMGLEISRR